MMSRPLHYLLFNYPLILLIFLCGLVASSKHKNCPVASFAGVGPRQPRQNSLVFKGLHPRDTYLFILHATSSTTKVKSTDTLLETGTVLRTAFRTYQKQDSKPSGRNYTTRKDEQRKGIKVTTAGIINDYNHYRTLALKSTPDRAVSLWTTDVMPLLKAYGFKDVQLGDLGENLSIEGVNYTFFEVGQRYQFTNEQYTAKDDDNDTVILEITEKMEPCGNLCKLPYINQDGLPPKERIQKCQDFLQVLDQHEGLRGWYAKVIQEGTIQPGDVVAKVKAEEETS